MPKSKEQSCGNCGAFVPEDEDGSEGGTCHRKAPHCQMEGMMQDAAGYATCWPWVALGLPLAIGARSGS